MGDLEYFDGPALGDDENDEDDWGYAPSCQGSLHPRKDTEVGEPPAKVKKSIDRAIPVEDIVDDDDSPSVSPTIPTAKGTIELTIKFGACPDAAKKEIHREVRIDSLLTYCKKRFQQLLGQSMNTMYELQFGNECIQITPGSTLAEYNVTTTTATLEVNVALDDEEKDFELFATETEALQAQKTRITPRSWIVLKLQGNANLLPTKHGNVAYLLMTKTETFGKVVEFIEEEKGWTARLKFDGDLVDDDETPEKQDMDSLDCIDFVKCL